MLVPYGSRCVVEPVKTVAESKGGILVDEEMVKAPQSLRVKVLAIGEQVQRTEVGDIVLVSQFGPTEAKESPFDKTLVVAEEDILCKVQPDKAKKK